MYDILRYARMTVVYGVKEEAFQENVPEENAGFCRIWRKDNFVIGYSNDGLAYIPSASVLKEGGYEDATLQIAFGLPAPWKDNIETIIISEVERLAKEAGVPQLN